MINFCIQYLTRMYDFSTVCCTPPSIMSHIGDLELQQRFVLMKVVYQMCPIIKLQMPFKIPHTQRDLHAL